MTGANTSEDQKKAISLAEEASKRVENLCQSAFRDGFAAGFQRGFEQGVAAGMGEAPTLRFLS